MTKSTTKSPTERRLRKEIRHLLEVYTPMSQSPKNTDHIVREFLKIIDDEVRRTRMSMKPEVTYTVPRSWRKVDELLAGHFGDSAQ